MLRLRKVTAAIVLTIASVGCIQAAHASEVLDFEGDIVNGAGTGLPGTVSGLVQGAPNTSNNPLLLTDYGYNYGGFTWSESISKTLQIYSEGRAVSKPVGASNTGVISPDTSPGAPPGTTITSWGTNIGSNDQTNTGITAYMAPINVAPTSLETSGNWVAAINNAGSSITFTGDTAFNFDGAFLYGSKYDEVITITATKAGGSNVTWNTGSDLFGITDSFADATHGMATFTAVGKTYDFGTTFDGVTSVTIQSLKGVAVIDNLVITTVPETSPYAMLLAGIGIIGLLGRRRANP